MRNAGLLASVGVAVCLGGAAAQQPAGVAAQSGGAPPPGQPVSAATQKPARPAQPQPIGSVVQLMQGIVVPASDMVFGAVKIQIAEKGWEEVFPQTDEEWLRLWQNSVVLAEAGNLLMVRGRPGARDQEDGWMSVARALSDGGVQAMKAAQAKDPKLFTEASEQIRATCSKCHLDYAPRRYARPAVNESDSKADVP